jgi:ligand-binding SRPBCC domain-containing protein
MTSFKFIREQEFNVSTSDLWNFISSPHNLSKITPPELNFRVINVSNQNPISAGQEIKYKLSPVLGINLIWVSKITSLKKGEYFVDEQEQGPYAFWKHEHIIEPSDKGTLMRDIVTYKPPFGVLGRLMNSIFIKNKLRQIFDFRAQTFNTIFSGQEYKKYKPHPGMYII